MDLRDIIDLVIATLLFVVGLYTKLLFCIPLASIYQERKIWLKPGVKPLNIVGYSKVYLYNLIWFTGSFVGCILAILLQPFYSASLDYAINSVVEPVIGKACHMILGPVEIIGSENLPASNEPVIYAANHSSQIDIGVSYYLRRSFKWISKRSVVYMPGVGMVMVLGRHLLIDRKGKSSIKKMYEEASNLLSKILTDNEKGSIFIFPQGTRSMSERLPLKDGAFNMAVRDGVSIIPISIDIPDNLWNDIYPFASPRTTKITIHKPIAVATDSDKENLKKLVGDAIYSVLPSREDRKQR